MQILAEISENETEKKNWKAELGRTSLASETTGRAGRKTAADNLWAKAHLRRI
jgi:hypothetical protein